ncbi:MAG TPA: hypothetical protein VMY59_08575 [Candidatus Thermoplasmatota archaeon]|nr:hypothetical protein [Candidatus Thermoplasmatota archaeon]
MTIKTNKILTAVIAIAIIASVAVLVYVNLPKQAETLLEDNTPHNTIPPVLTLIYDDEEKNFTLAELERLEPYTKKGGYRTESGFIKGMGNYTGVNITTLIKTIDSVPLQYIIQVISEDGNLSYNYSTILGDVTLYDSNNGSNPNPIGKGNMTMVLAYQYEGNWLNETSDGKLKIVFLDEKGSITKGSLWWKKVTSIRIITE